MAEADRTGWLVATPQGEKGGRIGRRKDDGEKRADTVDRSVLKLCGGGRLRFVGGTRVTSIIAAAGADSTMIIVWDLFGLVRWRRGEYQFFSSERNYLLTIFLYFIGRYS